MKFAFIIFKYFPFGGAQRDMMRIARGCVARGHSVRIYTLSWEGPLPDPGIGVEVLHGRGWTNHGRYRDFIGQVQQRLSAEGFDLAVGFNRLPGLDAYFAADPCFLERAHTLRGPLYRLTPRYRFFAGCERSVFGRDVACRILLLSRNEQPVFQRWYGTPDARFHLLPPVVDVARFSTGDVAQARAGVRQEFNFAPDDLLLLMVGSGFRTKGLDRSILALAALPPELRLRTRLVAVGQDNPKPFIALAMKMGVSAQVKVCGGRSDIPRLMQAADLLLHPAYRENTGLVLLEAMAAGLPVLASDVCGYACHVEAAGAGELVPGPFSQQGFNAQLKAMLLSVQRPVWGASGQAYLARLMTANPEGAEPVLLEQFAAARQGGADGVAAQ